MKRQQYLATLTSKLLALEHLGDLRDVLKGVAEHVGADGCVLWKLAPGSNLTETPPAGRLFVLGQWFKDGRDYWCSEPPNDSIGWKSILTNSPQNIRDISKRKRGLKSGSSLSDAGIRAACCVPIAFAERMGVLAAYRTTLERFDKSQVSDLSQVAELLPCLYEALRDKITDRTIQRINQSLRLMDHRVSDITSPVDEIKRNFQKVCEVLSHVYQCMQASIFLENPAQDPGVYHLMATTWPKPFSKTSLVATDPGLTGWVLSNNRPIRVNDLAHFERDKHIIQAEYPGLEWGNSLDIENAVREYMHLNPQSHLFPLSLMAAPIRFGEKVVGVIRCSVSCGAPYYFGESDIRLLQLVADQISHCWLNWVAAQEIQQDNESLRQLVESVAKLNDFVYAELSKRNPEESAIFSKTLEIMHSVIKGAEIMDVRLLDRDKPELYFAQVYGRAWSEGSTQENKERRNRTFPVSAKPPRSAGAYVFQTGRPYVVRSATEDPFYSETFPNVEKMLLVPISLADSCLGILDVRSLNKADFSESAQAIAELLGRQLGLYHHLGATIGALRKTETELNEKVKTVNNFQKQQARTFEDLGHQLKGPILVAQDRVKTILKDLRLLEPKVDGSAQFRLFEKKLMAVRGLCTKAEKVVKSIRLFANLVGDVPLTPNLTRLGSDDLIRKLVNAAVDFQAFANPDRAMRFEVKRDGFHVLNRAKILADPDWLDQVIYTLLDNASKYSFDETTVQISVGLTGTKRFYIGIRNRGIRIALNEPAMCIQRGWRSEEAKSTTGEGTGIGLWIVNAIMKAQNGDLEIIPTTTDYTTMVRVIFPTVEEQ